MASWRRWIPALVPTLAELVRALLQHQRQPLHPHLRQLLLPLLRALQTMAIAVWDTPSFPNTETYSPRETPAFEEGVER
jgi:hypothetical protein